jgi:hypothetical protein
MEQAPREASRPPVDLPRTLHEALPVFLRHPSPRILLAATTVALAARLAVGGFSGWDLVPLAALGALWPLQEWALHVFLLHWRPRTWRGRRIDFDVPRKHRAHHREPWRTDLVFIPLGSYVYSLPLLVGLWVLATRDAGLALTGITGHLALALHYEAVHFLVHTRVVPRTAAYRRLWRNHRLHHFKNEHYWFGVTRLGGDRLLGTSPEAREVPSSPTARRLWSGGPAGKCAGIGSR